MGKVELNGADERTAAEWKMRSYIPPVAVPPPPPQPLQFQPVKIASLAALNAISASAVAWVFGYEQGCVWARLAVYSISAGVIAGIRRYDGFSTPHMRHEVLVVYGVLVAFAMPTYSVSFALILLPLGSTFIHDFLYHGRGSYVAIVGMMCIQFFAMQWFRDSVHPSALMYYLLAMGYTIQGPRDKSETALLWCASILVQIKYLSDSMFAAHIPILTASLIGLV